MSVHVPSPQAPTDADLAARLQPVFDRIAAGTVQREQQRELPHAPVRWLLDAGFGALRVPRSHGGLGASLTQLLALLTELAAADSNIAQIFRAHFAFVEGELLNPSAAERDRWFPQIAAGGLIGAAMSEQGDATEIRVRLTPQPAGGWRLDGEKFYCTGTLYADWMTVYALEQPAEPATPAAFKIVMVATTAAGVERVDDWDGFGQRLTASGTTRFAGVAVPAEHLLRHFQPGHGVQEPYLSAFFQLYHLATLAGIGRAAHRDAIAYTRDRTRTFRVPGQTSPRHDPLVQSVIGRLSSVVFAADAVVRESARQLQAVQQAVLAGTATVAEAEQADIPVYQAQQVVIDLVLRATQLLFDVGGASAVSRQRQFDRHWRNARTLASHNPAIQREQALGHYFLNDVTPLARWREIQQASGGWPAKTAPAGTAETA